MGNGNDSILEAYLFETNSLLEQLDSLVLAAEEKDSFSEEDVNTIFRIMHTIKGSSAMMEYSSLMTIAHRAEDLFAIVRDKSMEIVPEALRPALFDLLFQIIRFQALARILFPFPELVIFFPAHVSECSLFLTDLIQGDDMQSAVFHQVHVIDTPRIVAHTR